MENSEYEIEFYLKEIRHKCAHYDQIVKNRRFLAMQELEAGGEYFEEEAMKGREPLLYEQMIGRFMTEEEKKQKLEAAVNRSDLKFSSILMQYLEDDQERALYSLQKQQEVTS